LGEGDELGVGGFGEPAAVGDELLAEVAEVADGAAEACAAEAEEDEEDFDWG